MRLKQLREAKNMTQTELSVRSGVSQTYISDLEAGKKQPTIPIVKKLAAALGVSVSELLGEEDLSSEFSAGLCPTGTE
jgi:transcriptional regulator, XRE family